MLTTNAIAVCTWSFLFSIAHEADPDRQLRKAHQEIVGEIAQERFFSSSRTLSLLTWPEVLNELEVTSDQIVEIDLAAVGVSPGRFAGNASYSDDFAQANRTIFKQLDANQIIRFVQISNQLNRQSDELFSEYLEGPINNIRHWTEMSQGEYEIVSDFIEKSRTQVNERIQEIYANYHHEIEEFIAASKSSRIKPGSTALRELKIVIKTSFDADAKDSELFEHFASDSYLEDTGIGPSDIKELRALLIMIREEFHAAVDELVLKHHSDIRDQINRRSRFFIYEKYGHPFFVLTFEENSK